MSKFADLNFGFWKTKKREGRDSSHTLAQKVWRSPDSDNKLVVKSFMCQYTTNAGDKGLSVANVKPIENTMLAASADGSKN